MSKANEIVDLSTHRIAVGDVVFFVPDVRGYGNQLRVWWNQVVMHADSSVAWGAYPSFADFLEYSNSALLVYCHLVHSPTYVARSVRTESVSKIRATWGDLSVPRYIRDIFREVIRPMHVADVSVTPYLALNRAGVGPAQGFGILPTKFRGVLNALKNCVKGTAWDDFVPLEIESPKSQPFFVASDTSVVLFEKSVDRWRLEAITATRHVRRSCEFFDTWQRQVLAPIVPDARFIARSLVRDGLVVLPLPNPRGDGPSGDIYLQGVLTDRRSIERYLRLMISPGAGPVPNLPPTVVGHAGLLVMYAATGVLQATMDRIAVGSDRFTYPGLPPANVVTVSYHNVHVERVSGPRFPSLEDHSQTPPTSPNAASSKGVRPKKGRSNKKAGEVKKEETPTDKTETEGAK